MYLKSLEIQGFKSFANKIDFKFHNGITGIVGPNGSGKSNVGDAVRWVLGEQSARQLRGSNMQDVIFSGTENRKPLGFASVSITLDNADHKLPVDYEEVTVSRRVYRSGESEYRLNGTSCRLKDIQEIFYDTGIGKEGYSIIGQGQIEKILSGRPEDRRELFDEAAGIVKFKRRKAAAVKKLEDERANLVRVNDILSELQRQLVPLQHQAEQAKIYLKKKEELKKIDLHLFLLEMEQRKAELANLDEKRKIAEEQLSDIKKEYETIRIHYETEEKAIEELEERIEQIREQERQSQLLHQQLTGQIEVLKEQIRAQEDQEVRLKERKSVIESELSRKEKQRKAEEQAFLLAKEKQEQVSLTEADYRLEADATTAMLSHLEMQIEDGKNEKLRIYEADGDSIRQAALEIYRESKDSGWTGSWTERYRVSRVCTKGQYVSVLLDSDLKEGNLKKIPHRESYVLDLESGQQVTLEKLLGKSREECYQLLQEAYRDKLRENPGVYYADAEEKIAALNPEKIGWDFTETAIVCYLEPYTIALPEEGYVEAELPIEDDRE